MLHQIQRNPAARALRRRRSNTGDENPPVNIQQALHSPGSAQHMVALQRTIGNRAAQQLIQREEGAAVKKPPSKTLYMGMNSGGKSEAATLKGALKDNVVTSMNDEKLEKSLDNDAGIKAWLDTNTPVLKADAKKYQAAFDVIQQTDAGARDQMAQVVKMFYSAEQGDFVLERIVMSGHSNGVELWGDAEKNFNPGKFMLNTDLQRLTGAFPTAAGQVEDVMFSACFTVSSIELVIKAFPNIRTVWGYAGFSPAAGQGAEEHIAQWEKSTRGDKTLEEKNGVGKAALWTREASKASKDKNGFVRNDPAKANLNDLEQAFFGMSVDIREMNLGNKALVQNTLDTAYTYVQMMLAHPELKSPDKEIIIHWSEVLLRLRYYDKVCGRFGSEYAGQIKKGYDAIGRKIPNFGKISRAGLKAEIEAFKTALAATPNADAQAFLDKYLTGFWKWSTDIIKTEWI